MELLPLGPVLFIDTAGIDDDGALGEQRIAKTRQALDRTDLGVLVAEAGAWGEFEEALLAELRARSRPGRRGVQQGRPRRAGRGRSLARLAAETVAVRRDRRPVGRRDRRPAARAARHGARPTTVDARRIVGDLVGPGELVVLVVPIDKEAPKGRLDPAAGPDDPRPARHRRRSASSSRSASCRPRWQASTGRPGSSSPTRRRSCKVAADTPPGVLLTSFSILFARFQGDLAEMVARDPGDRAPRSRATASSIAEACTHHPDRRGHRPREDPALADAVHRRARSSSSTVQGHDFPDDLSPYALVVHCGSCMGNRREMLSPHPPLPAGGRPDHELRPDDRLLARHLRARARPVPGRPRGLPRIPREAASPVEVTT